MTPTAIEQWFMDVFDCSLKEATKLVWQDDKFPVRMRFAAFAKWLFL